MYLLIDELRQTLYTIYPAHAGITARQGLAENMPIYRPVPAIILSIYPALAGMFPVYCTIGTRGPDLPRACGGVPAFISEDVYEA